MKIEVTRPIGEIAAELEASIPIFEDMRVDYSYAGSRTLKDACYLAGVPVEKVVTLLEETALHPSVSPGARDWRRESIKNLIDHLVERHHLYAWSHMTHLRNGVSKLVRTEGSRHPVLISLETLVHDMCEEMEDHMTKEEEIVFPYLRKAAMADEKGKGHIKHSRHWIPEGRPLQILLWEHGIVNGLWKEIRYLTHDYQPPEDASAELKELYRGLSELELDLHHHTHLENNILFKRAIEMGLLE